MVVAVDSETAGFVDEGSKSTYRGGIGEGHAVFVFNDGKKYDGNWKDNEQEGIGEMQYPGSGVRYEGEWRNGKRHGQGKYVWGCGSVYDGEWKEGKKHGKGKYTLASGNVYEGDFVEDRWEGHGKYTNVQARARGPNATLVEYEGEWKSNRRVGIGKSLYSNGDIEICKYADVECGNARPVRIGRGIRWVGLGKAAFTGPVGECPLSVLIDASEAGIQVDEKTKFQLIKNVSDGVVMSTVGGTAKGWDSNVILKLQERGVPGSEKGVRYFVNRRREAMLLENGKAVREITIDEAHSIVKLLGRQE